MPKKPRQKTKQTQKQEQSQKISIRIGDVSGKKPRRKYTRKPKREPDPVTPLRQLPPVVYQTLPQLTSYSTPDQYGVVREGKSKKVVLEDTGIIGTEGRGVEILDLPTKKETLSSLIRPVDKPKSIIASVESPLLTPRRPPRDSMSEVTRSFDIPTLQINPVETVSPLLREQKQQSIIEPPMQKFPITQMEMSFEPQPRMQSPRQPPEIIEEEAEEEEPVKTDKPQRIKVPRVRKPLTDAQKLRAREYQRKRRQTMRQKLLGISPEQVIST
jgi:hypothetical protein